MTSTKPYLRKKSVLIMYKVFLQFPEALRPAFPRLKEKLEDPDPGLYFFYTFSQFGFYFIIFLSYYSPLCLIFLTFEPDFYWI